MIKTLATTAIALILTFSIATTVFAQNQTGATGLQIQVVPQIQRGHQQHLTIFSVDDQGNEVNASEIQTTITNEKGNLVGPKTLYTQSGEDVGYKVGPNTRPQNITVDSCLTEQDLCATQTYYVFPKGQAQQPLPLPPELPAPEPPVANNTEDGEIIVPDNSTDVTTPEGGNETLPEQPVPGLPAENETAPPVVNETVPEQPEIPIEVNETIPIPIPSNETTGNETIPVPLPINETDTNQTVPVPPLPVEPEVPPTGETGNQTEDLPVEIPAQNETDTIPIELPINSSTGNETIPIPPIEVEPPTSSNQTQNTTVEPEPLPPTNGGGQTPNGTTPAELQLNTTQSFDQLENATAILDQKLNEVLDNGNETNRGDLKALTGDALGAMGEVSDGFVDATSDQMLLVQQTATSVSESIDEILAADTDDSEGEGEDDQGENEQ